MGRKLTYERYQWFHWQVKAGRYPSARQLAEHFEISRKQAQRDIEFMYDRLAAPLEYNPNRRGYEYGNDGYELPPVWLKEEELVALCLAQRLSAAVPDRELKGALERLLRRFVDLCSDGSLSLVGDICGKVSVKNVEYYRVREPVFHAVAGALFRNRALRIVYRTPHKGEETQRLILPLHLLCYMGSWYLVAFCTLRNELRDFALSRIRALEESDGDVALPPSLPPIREYIRQTFGLLSGPQSTEVILRFRPGIAPWVAEQVWHDAQEASADPDGSLHLRFPVSGFEEVSREILKYGADVEVVAPDGLKRIIKEKIEKMAALYR